MFRKTNSRTPSFVYGFQPAYNFSRIFGLTPFSIVCDAKGEVQKFKVRVFDAVWFLISMGIYSAIAFLVYQSIEIAQDSDGISILMVGDDLLLLANLISVLLIIGVEMCNRFQMVNILWNFTDFDAKVRSHFSQISRSIRINKPIKIIGGNFWDSFWLPKEQSTCLVVLCRYVVNINYSGRIIISCLFILWRRLFYSFTFGLLWCMSYSILRLVSTYNNSYYSVTWSSWPIFCVELPVEVTHYFCILRSQE